jgi:hypothetical protein
MCRLYLSGLKPSFFTLVKWPFTTILSTHVLRLVAKGLLTHGAAVATVFATRWDVATNALYVTA